MADRFRPPVRRYSRGELPSGRCELGAWRSELWSAVEGAAERRLQRGKVQNLRVACAALNGIVIPRGETFSFWKQIGRATAARGFATGRELREGCLIPTIGGGLCQLSGAIYNAALEAGLEIVERHAHTEKGVSTLAQVGRDATVFWNYVDLRLRAGFEWQLEVRLSADLLHVRIHADRRRASGAPGAQAPIETADAAPNACDTCGLTACFRHQGADGVAGELQTAVLVDEYWPEFDDYLAFVRDGTTTLCRPLDGRRWRKANYLWTSAGYGRICSATSTALRRAWAMRKQREQGAARQRAMLEWDAFLAEAYRRQLGADHSHLIVAQNLLPFLWIDGTLGGRTFDVLLTRLPLLELQAALDRGARAHPESSTCGDFRAPAWLAKAESEALAAAGAWITPHRAIAALAGERAILLPWKMPASANPPARPRGGKIAFPASTLCRKGAYELRSAARALECEVVCAGGFLEGSSFWAGVAVSRSAGDWMEGACAVVLPAYVEHRPRRLLAALARGLPVIATAACGLEGLPGVITVPEGDAAALQEALAAVLEQAAGRPVQHAF